MPQAGEGDVVVPDHHRPHLDGIRTVAVYLVVAFHAGIDRLDGGFLGVDVFFVLSGYLVTQLLVRDIDRHDGVRFGRFYSRRARRLLPAAAINLVVTSIVFTAIAAPATVRAAVASVQGAALYVSNWVFIAQSADYFGPDIDRSPVAHYWSLSVEEQFYLLWPVLLAGLFALGRRAGERRMVVVRVAVAVGALASLGAALLLAVDHVDRAYFGTDTRAYQLLAGALLALSPGVVAAVARRAGRWMPWASAAALGALVMASTWVVELGPVSRGALAAALTVAVLVTLEASSGGWVRSWLSWAPMTYLGRISYGTYLWHWIVILAIAEADDLGGPATFAVAAPIATGLAALSYELVERPIRSAPLLDRHRVVVIGAGLAVSVLIAVVVAPAALERDQGSVQVASSTGSDGTPVDVDWRGAAFDVADLGTCTPGEPVACPLVEGDGQRVLLVGESHAAMYTPLMEEVARRLDLELAGLYLPFCPWTRGVQYTGVTATCYSDQADAFETVIPEYDPDIVVLAHRPIDDPQNEMPISAQGEGPLEAGDAGDALARAVRRSVEDLRADGRRVVMIEPVPASTVDDDPLVCLSEAEVLEECRFVASDAPLGEERIMRDLDEGDEGVWSLDLDALACPYLPICDPVVGGLIVHRDSHHLTATFAASLADGVEAFFVDNGVVDSG